MKLPILYSYRRCPYAMRARMALDDAGIAVEIREVSLKQKPPHMLLVSPKGTVPVMVLPDGRVLEQSLDIMRWALQQRDASSWLDCDMEQAMLLVAENDGTFKQHLDRYKYADRFPEYPSEHYRAQGEIFLAKLEQYLQGDDFLLGDAIRFADIAIFPFIRQFAAVDPVWFESACYPRLKLWLQYFIESELFQRIMVKYPTYIEAGTA